MRTLLLLLLIGCEPASLGGGGLGGLDDTGWGLDDTGADTGEGRDTAPAEDTGADMQPWQRFEEDRAEYLASLAAVVQQCVPRTDTTWPAFHGCYDWHSAVHGVYALHAVYRLTGDEESLAIAEAVLTETAIAGELALVEAGSPSGEVPYGYAWLLVLAVEREAATGKDDLAPLADAAASRLEAWLDDLSEAGWVSAMRDDDYDNLSWTVLCLWQWATWSGDDALAEVAARHAERLMLYDDLLPLSLDADDADDFFPPALHRVLTILTVLPSETTEPWLNGFLPDTLALPPILDPTSAHQSGLNFSRAWGLWALWSATGDAQWRDLYVDHIATHMAQPDYWAENYTWYSHWVPQFGVYAIALSMDG